MRVRAILAIGLSALWAAASAQLRVGTWNVTNYSGGRASEFQTAIYGEFQGRKFAPDVLLGQEFLNAAAVNEFCFLLNTAPGSPGDWLCAPFLDGPDSDNGFFYRASKVILTGYRIIAYGSTATNNQPRDTVRYDIQPRLGPPNRFNDRNANSPLTIALYSSHMKSGSNSTDQARRLVEADRVRADAETLPESWHFLIGGDFNIQSSNQAAFQELVGAQENDAGRFWDPINTPGSWNNNNSYRFVHTQDPASGAQMDDRLDFLLLSGDLVDGDGLDYIGDPSQPYSTTTWNDPNHSYRSWGNDGSTFDASLRITGNEMVGPTIAQALQDSAVSGGHLPVFLDLKVFPTINTPTIRSFGQVWPGMLARQRIAISHLGDIKRWNRAGIANLRYWFTVEGPFSAPAGTFTLAPGAVSPLHSIQMDTSLSGVKVGRLTLHSNDPLRPAQVFRLIGQVQ